MGEIATRASRKKLLPLPESREELDLTVAFSAAEGELMRRGHIPSDMDDKWFIFFENGWLYFHRSWTGTCIYTLKLDDSPGGVRVIESWASRDEDQYRSPGIERERELVLHLIRSLLLSKD